MGSKENGTREMIDGRWVWDSNNESELHMTDAYQALSIDCTAPQHRVSPNKMGMLLISVFRWENLQVITPGDIEDQCVDDSMPL